MNASLAKPQESVRIENLFRCGAIGDVPNDPSLDRLLAAVATAFEVPIALVSVVEKHRQVFAARFGLDVSETPRDVSFCAHAVATGEPLIVNDTFEDPRFVDNALVTGSPYIRFYAGIPVFTPEGMPIGTLCVIDTQPRSLSSDRLGLLQNFARLVEERLVLEDQAKRLQGGDQEYVQLAVHDLKGPLTGLQGLIGLLRDSPSMVVEDPALTADLSYCVSSLQNQLFDLLDRLVGSRGEIRTRPIEMEKLVQRVLKMFEPQAHHRGQRIVFENSASKSSVRGNDELLSRCLFNLIDNARKHTPVGGEIRVSFSNDAQSVAVRVENDGPEIAKGLEESIFEPLTRGDAPRAGSYGLGLASAREAARRHGGTLRLETPVVRGASFVLSLPLA